MIIYTLESVVYRKEMVYTKGFMSGVSCRDSGLDDWRRHCARPGFESRIQAHRHKGKERTLQEDQDYEEMQGCIVTGTGVKWGRVCPCG